MEPLQETLFTHRENNDLEGGCVTAHSGGLGHSPKVAERKPAPFEIPTAWLICAVTAANARPGYPGNRAIEVEVLPAGKHYVAKALIREGSRHVARLVGDFCPTEQEALHSLEPLFVRFASTAPGKAA